jgi:hypothetical protein
MSITVDAMLNAGKGPYYGQAPNGETARNDDRMQIGDLL